MLSRSLAPQTHGKPPRTAFLLVLEFVRESSSTGRTCAALPCSRPAPGIEANGFYFELLGTRGPQNKNRLLFHWIFQTCRLRPMQKSNPRQDSRQTVFILSSWEPEGFKIKTVCYFIGFARPAAPDPCRKATPDRNGGKRFLF